MQVTLTPEAEEALRQELARSPGRPPEEIVEQALTEMSRRAVPATSPTKTAATPEEFRTWLAELRLGARPAPPLDNEAFSRQMIHHNPP